MRQVRLIFFASFYTYSVRAVLLLVQSFKILTPDAFKQAMSQGMAQGLQGLRFTLLLPQRMSR
jgi:hypothetical protein